MRSHIPYTPLIPSDEALQQAGLPDKSLALSTAAARLAGQVARQTRHTIIRHMAVINSYYSNLIEGNKTRPHEIRAAQQGRLLDDPARRDLQLESLAHIKVQQWIAEQNLSVDTLFSPDFMRAIHYEFYRYVPESLYELKNAQGEVIDQVIPGQWRSQAVTVGRHIPPEAESIGGLMQQFCEVYHPNRFSGDQKIIALMCAHHRLAWIHPFADGNGRVMRLFTDTALKIMGMESEGIWCLSRGLARRITDYKSVLASADMPRQGDLDGRGPLSQQTLVEFCEFMLDTALEQVSYMSGLLTLDAMQERIQRYIEARNDGRVAGMGTIKETAVLILYNAFARGALKRSMAMELCGMSERSARRLLSQLKEEGLLSETSSRSDLMWEIPEHAEPWYFPQLTPGI